MVGAHHVVRKEALLENTLNLKKLIGKNVISKGGMVIGRVSEIRINPKGLQLEGVLIRRDIFRKPIYIGKGYFSHLSHESIILNIEISLLIKNRKVIKSDGKVLGKVVEVVRRGHTNEVKELIVKSLFSKRFSVHPSGIKYLGKSIILNPHYHAKKIYFWQKSK